MKRRNVPRDRPAREVGVPAAHVFLMGYTNGYIGYFPEQKAFENHASSCVLRDSAALL